MKHLKIVLVTHTNKTLRTIRMLANELKWKLYTKKNALLHKENCDVLVLFGNIGTTLYNTLLYKIYPKTVINKQPAVLNAINKLKTFNILSQVPEINLPEFTQNPLVASKWLEKPGTIVVGRELLTGSQGKGIQIITNPNTEFNLPLYTKYIKKYLELRVHCVCCNDNHTETYVQEKRRRKNFAGTINQYVRNVKNGWVYCTHVYSVKGDAIHEKAIIQAKAAIKALELTYGAVDIVYNKLQDKCYVLEVNTAPRIVGSTINFYAKAFNLLIKDISNDTTA